MIARVWSSMPLSITLGALIGLLLSPISWGAMDWLMAGYDRAYPVVEMSGQITGRTPTSVDVHISGRKSRDCTYIQLQAYAVRAGTLHDANIQRLDIPERGDTKQRGAYDIGTWRVWPTDGATGALVMVQHLCAGRIVTTKITEVTL